VPWAYSFDARALRELRKLDRPAQKHIIAYWDARIAAKEDPRRFGKPLRGEFAGLWRYRVRDYRLICQIKDEMLLVLVVSVGHRKNVYD
jgi:mRNA interferase RelE/StbE